MSTQVSSFQSVPFSITQPQQNLRLLELPPDLLELLTSDNKPATLQLKSASPNANTSTKSTKSPHEYLHLCSKDKVWAVRQVSTSNSVYITTPVQHEPKSVDADGMDLDNASKSTIGVTAIAQPTSSLELTPLPITQKTVEDTILAILPVHDIPNTDSDSPPPAPPKSDHPTMQSLKDDLPYPKNILGSALRNLFIFQARSSAYIPSPALLLQSYKHLINTLLIEDRPDDDPENDEEPSDLASFDVIGAGDLKTAIFQEEGEVYACVVQAILERFVDLDHEEGDDEEVVREKYGVEGKLRGREMTEWVGRLLIICAGPDGIGAGKFVEDWRDIVPRAWWEYCDMGRLEGVSVLDGRLRCLAKGEGAKVDGESAGGAGGKRKWHERFGKDRER